MSDGTTVLGVVGAGARVAAVGLARLLPQAVSKPRNPNSPSPHARTAHVGTCRNRTQPITIGRCLCVWPGSQIIRNEALLLLVALTRMEGGTGAAGAPGAGAGEVQKIAAFEGAFDRVAELLREEGGLGGGMVVQVGGLVAGWVGGGGQGWEGGWVGGWGGRVGGWVGGHRRRSVWGAGQDCKSCFVKGGRQVGRFGGLGAVQEGKLWNLSMSPLLAVCALHAPRHRRPALYPTLMLLPYLPPATTRLLYQCAWLQPRFFLIHHGRNSPRPTRTASS